jgi:ABC-type polysaccharide/polyol phosphate export permease
MSLKKVLPDLLKPILEPNIWMTIGYLDVIQSYRRSFLGPIWITLSIAIQAFAMTFIFGALFGMPTKEYAQFIVTGLIAWAWLMSILTEAGNVFIINAKYIKETAVSKPILIWSSAFRLMIITSHNLILFLILIVTGVISLTYTHILLPFIILLYFLISIPLTVIMGILFARYRDIPRLVSSTIVILMFITPIFWKAEMLGGTRGMVVQLNPFMYLIEMMRKPMMGVFNEGEMVIFMIIFIIVWTVGLLVYKKFSNSVVFWVD